MNEILPLTVISGFLGSGKTTLLNRVLRSPHGRRVAVIVNEFGEVGIDGALIQGGEAFVELDNGCLCCALNEDLVATLAEIGKRSDVEQVIIETTGIADPLPVGHVVSRPELSARYRLDALVTTVDVLNVARYVEESEEGAQQIRRADLLVLTKTDLCDEAAKQKAVELVRSMNPHARLLEGAEDSTIAVILDAGLDSRPLVLGMPMEHGDHDHAHRHHSFQSVSFEVGRRRTIRLAFEEFLEGLPASIYRSKGIVRIQGEPGSLIFHTVGGRVDLWHEPDRIETSKLVFIGHGLEVDALREEVEMLFEDAG